MATERSEFSNLLKEIKMSETYSEKILSAFDNWTKTEEVPFDITHIKNAINAYPEQAAQIMLFLLLSLEERKNGAWSVYPRDIFIDTISDFSSFVSFYKKPRAKRVTARERGLSTMPRLVSSSLAHLNTKLSPKRIKKGSRYIFPRVRSFAMRN